MKLKIVSLVSAFALILAMGWAYAGPKHESDPGHYKYQGNGYGHVKHDDVSPS